MAKKFRRRNYFTKKGFQSRFVVRFLVISCIWNLITIMLFNFLASRKMDALLFSMRLPAADTGSILLREAFYSNAVAVFFVVLLFFMTARGLYNKIVSSLYRIRADLLRLERGDLGSRIMLSQDDEFGDFAGEMNYMAAELHHRFQGIKGHVRHINKAVKRLERAGANLDEKCEKEKITHHLKALEDEVRAFRI